jgi:MFS family permease
VVIGALSLISSFAVAGLTAPANGLFVQALPAEFRARAFGVMQSGLALFQGGGLLAAGYIASHVEVSTAVTIFSSIGVCVMIGISVIWPSTERVDETIASVRAHNAVTIAAVDGRRPRHAAPETTEEAAASQIVAEASDVSARSSPAAPKSAPSDIPAQTAAPSQPTTPAPGARSSIAGYTSGQTHSIAMPPAETPWTG